MVKISELAAEKARQILKAEGKSEWGLRVFTSQSSCCGPSYGMDLDENPAEGDEVIERDGLRVFMDKDTVRNLSGMEIDFIDNGEQQGFVLTGGKPSSCDSGCSSCG